MMVRSVQELNSCRVKAPRAIVSALRFKRAAALSDGVFRRLSREAFVEPAPAF